MHAFPAFCLCGAAVLLTSTSPALGQEPERPVRWTAEATASRARAGGKFDLHLRATVEERWYLYALTQPAGGPFPLEIGLDSAGVFRLGGEVIAPKPREYADRNFNLFTQIHRDSLALRLPVRVLRGAAAGPTQVTALVTFQTCNDRYCLPPRTDTLSVAIEVEEAPVAASAQPSRPESRDSTVVIYEAGARADTVLLTERRSAADLAVFNQDAGFGGTRSMAGFLWVAVVMGLLSLLTPCVFPMVPITVGLFSSDAGADRSRSVLRATAYGAGMVGTFTGLGLLAAVVFGAGGIVRFASNPWLNLFVAVLFGAFALSLLGVFELRVPSALVTRISSRASRGSDLVAPVTLGAAFTVTSFTCTGPFIGTLLVLASRGDWQWPLLGLLVYSIAFAAPFVALALAPGMLRRLPRAGSWLRMDKRLVAVIELAAAAKFLSNADLVWHWGIFTRDVVLVIWILCAIALAAIALHERTARWRIAWSPVRAVIALVALWLAGWLTTGLRGRRVGELEAFLPPPSGGVLLAANQDELTWRLNDYDGSLQTARSQTRPVLVDFTGYTCTNCRWMEANMFPRNDIRVLLEQYVRVRLFTDGRGQLYRDQQALQQRLFGTVALPYYAVIAPNGAPIATFLGMTRDPAEFRTFLSAGLSSRRIAAEEP